MTRAGAEEQVRGERGAVLISGMLFALALMLVIGLAVDMARAFIVRRELVTLADDSALSGSQAIDVQAVHAGRIELDPPAARAAASQTIATASNVRHHVAADRAEIVVTLRRRVPTTLLRLVGMNTLDVSASATAEPRAP